MPERVLAEVMIAPEKHPVRPRRHALEAHIEHLLAGWMAHLCFVLADVAGIERLRDLPERTHSKVCIEHIAGFRSNPLNRAFRLRRRNGIGALPTHTITYFLTSHLNEIPRIRKIRIEIQNTKTAGAHVKICAQSL